jgi:aspartate racemase
MPRHIGIVGCSAEGAALCYRTICVEGARLLGGHAHPEVSLHSHSLEDYLRCFERNDWAGVGDLMLASAEKLARIGAEFLICPDNTIHQALPRIAARLPLPWLHIAEVVADEAVARGCRRLGVTGTRWLLASEVYPEALSARGLECVRPNAAEREETNRIINDELVADAGCRLRRGDSRLHRDSAADRRCEFAAADAGLDAAAGAGGAAAGGR